MTGRAGAELAALPDLFLLNAANRAFIEGQSNVIHVGTWQRYRGQFITALVTCPLVYFILRTWNAEWAVALAALDAVCLSLLAAAGALRQRQRLKRLATEGQLLRGELVAAFVQKRLARGHKDFVFTGRLVGYAFTTPDGRRLYGREPIVVTPGRFASPPRPGGAVVVAYADDRCYELL